MRSPRPRSRLAARRGHARVRGARATDAGRLRAARRPAGEDAVEIDQLYVTPDGARARASAARLVEAALAAGGRDVAWVVADDEGQARALYERLGFETVWRRTRSCVTPGSSS